MHTEPTEGEAARRVSLLGGSHEDVVACGDEIPIGVETLRDVELSCDMREERQRGDQLRHVDTRWRRSVARGAHPAERQLTDFFDDRACSTAARSWESGHGF